MLFFSGQKAGNPAFFLLNTASVFILPFLCSDATIDPVLLPRFFFWALLLFLLTLLITIQGKTVFSEYDFTILRRIIFPVLFSYFALSAFSMFQAVNTAESIFEFFRIFLFSVFFYVSCLIITSCKNALMRIAESVTCAAFVLGIIALCQYSNTGYTFISGNYRVYATMANKNLLASALFLMLPFIFYGIYRSSGKKRMFRLSVFIISLWIIIICQCRSVWLAILLSGSGTCLIGIYRRRKKTFPDAVLLSALLLIFFIIILSFFMISSSDRIMNLSLFSTDSLHERIRIWGKTVRMIRDAPLSGVGPGQWSIIIPRYGPVEVPVHTEEGLTERIPRRPHNDYLWVCAETGIPGLFFYLLFFLVLIFYCYRLIFYSDDEDRRIIALCMLFGISGYMMIAFLSFPKERIFHNVFLILISACVLSAYHSEFPFQQKTGNRKTDENDSAIFYGKSRTGKYCRRILLPHLFILAGLVCCTVFGYFRLNAEIRVRKAITARNTGEWATVIAEISRTDFRFCNLDPASVPFPWYRGMARYEAGDIEAAAKDFQQACIFHPYHFHSLYNAGICLSLMGKHRKAAEYYQRAYSLNPKHKKLVGKISAISGMNLPAF